MKRSSIISVGDNAAPARSLLRAVGLKGDDFKKPFVGIANSFTEINPGHSHLRELVENAKKGIREAGGIPFEFNTIAVDDGICNGHEGMNHSLPSRENIANAIEHMVEAHQLDALLCLTNCDKITPGMMIATVRINIPTVIVSGGAMSAGKLNSGRIVDLVTVFEGLGELQNNRLSKKELEEIEESGCPTCGSCSGTFTANTMNCLCEVLGLSIPGNGTIPAIDNRRADLVYNAGKLVMDVYNKNITPRSIIDEESIDNAVVLDMALGGSTNSVLHMLAFAREAHISYSLNKINELSAKVPLLCKGSPARPEVHMEDIDRNGGISTILKELSKIPDLLKLDKLTVLGKPLKEQIASAPLPDGDIIKPIDTPFSTEGGLKIVYGNIAPEGGVVKTGAVAASMRVFKGPARVFDSIEDSQNYLTSGGVKEGEVIIISMRDQKEPQECPKCYLQHHLSWV
uniref:Dihydroxyacid dehydratase n=1 Tax=Candidatus Kentrum eta TaxID=2126337 RepID=A0A450VAY8_9GAMM|nr:MAG: dihydroxyacid dehydratase [Candidatus Kentron sp. H]VFK01935.1 MAG: dihydroxyacid dehydratase [Candidatus Kentron sp. H]VFK05243.1 MAG: dihydroxyacid dehydratase [Candidatus Kentron sp. H]